MYNKGAFACRLFSGGEHPEEHRFHVGYGNLNTNIFSLARLRASSDPDRCESASLFSTVACDFAGRAPDNMAENMWEAARSLDYGREWYCDAWRLHSSLRAVHSFRPGCVEVEEIFPLGAVLLWQPRTRGGRAQGSGGGPGDGGSGRPVRPASDGRGPLALEDASAPAARDDWDVGDDSSSSSDSDSDSVDAVEVEVLDEPASDITESVCTCLLFEGCLRFFHEHSPRQDLQCFSVFIHADALGEAASEAAGAATGTLPGNLI